MNNRESIESIVMAGLCNSCGTCTTICPQNAIRMEETPAGLLFAKVLTTSCNSCGLCLRVCSGSHLEQELLATVADPFKGKVLAAYCAYASDHSIRMNGQSGGIVATLLSYLLDSGKATKALVTQMPDDGSLRPKALLTNEKGALLNSQGSKYCPVALNAAIPNNVGKGGEKIAVVGLPCHIHGIRNCQQHNDHWKTGIGLSIGLFCDRTLAYSAIDYLIERGKTATKDVMAFRYRDKGEEGWPGSVYIRTKDKKKILLPSHERMAIKEFLTPLRCRLCFDKMNVLSDISVGDAWGIREEKEGFSVLLVRTKQGLNLLQEAEKDGVVKLYEVDAQEVFVAQGVEERRRSFDIYSALCKKVGRVLPLTPGNKPVNFSLKNQGTKVFKQRLMFSEALLTNDKTKIIKSIDSKRKTNNLKKILKKILSFFKII